MTSHSYPFLSFDFWAMWTYVDTYQEDKLKVLYLAPLFLMTSTVSSTKYRSLTYAKISSQISCKRERWVRFVKNKTGIISGSGKLWRFCLAFFSDSSASWYVSPGLPVTAQLHTRLLHRMVRSKKSLIKKQKIKTNYLFHKFHIKVWYIY